MQLRTKGPGTAPRDPTSSRCKLREPAGGTLRGPASSRLEGFESPTLQIFGAQGLEEMGMELRG